MGTQVTAYVKPGHVRLLQEAMKSYPSFRFMFNPYPIKQSDPVNSKWCVGIDYGSGHTDEIQKFESFWARLETPIVEAHNKFSFWRKINCLLKPKQILIR